MGRRRGRNFVEIVFSGDFVELAEKLREHFDNFLGGGDRGGVLREAGDVSEEHGDLFKVFGDVLEAEHGVGGGVEFFEDLRRSRERAKKGT